MQKKLGIIAGSGALPVSVVQACQKAKRPFCVIGLKGFVNKKDFPAKIPFFECRLGAAGRLIQTLKKEKVSEIILLGGVRRPSVWEIFPDFTALKLLSKVTFSKGDDGLLRSIIRQIEAFGFTVVGVSSVLPELLTPKGILGSVQPNAHDFQDIKRGTEVAHLLGKADVGQAVIVQQGLVLALEGIEGTAALIKRSAPLKRKGKAPVLVKMCKPTQDRRVDLPTIGVQTIQQAHQAGIKGIALQAGTTVIADVSKTIEQADKLNIFLVGI